MLIMKILGVSYWIIYYIFPQCYQCTIPKALFTPLFQTAFLSFSLHRYLATRKNWQKNKSTIFSWVTIIYSWLMLFFRILQSLILKSPYWLLFLKHISICTKLDCWHIETKSTRFISLFMTYHRGFRTCNTLYLKIHMTANFSSPFSLRFIRLDL